MSLLPSDARLVTGGALLDRTVLVAIHNAGRGRLVRTPK